jgi:uncharacterized protein YjdB
MRKPPNHPASALVALALPLFLASCSGDEGVSRVSVDGVALNPATLTVTAGRTAPLAATVSPADAANKNVAWASGDPTKATVASAGLGATVTGVAAGASTITVRTDDGGKTAECVVNVTPQATGVSLDKPALPLVVNSTGTLTAAMVPAGVSAADSAVVWESSNAAVATVSNATGATVTIRTCRHSL